MKIQQIVSDVLYSNTFVITDNGEALIVDAGASLKKVKRLVGKNKVVGVLLTHGHFDHCYNIKEYIEEFKCPVIIHSHGLVTMKSPNLNYGEGFSVKPTEDFFTIWRDSDIKIGHFKFTAYVTPGHSPCGLTFKFGDDVFAGDTIFYNGIGRLDLVESDDEKMVRSLEKVYKLKFKKIHSGHGKDSSYEEQQRNLRVYIKFLSRHGSDFINEMSNKKIKVR